MKGLPIYLWLDIGSLLVPFIASFHPKIRFDKELRYVLPGIMGSLILYILWDIIFTQKGVWGFNADYLVGIDIFGLPIEEWLFFICIPYACLFTLHCIEKLMPSWRMSTKWVRIISLVLIALWSVSALIYNDRLYTLVNFIWAALLLGWVLKSRSTILSHYFVSYLMILAPFLIVNGILTGSGLAEPVVWYNNQELIGLRVMTIPIEDFTYAFTMLLFPLLLARTLKR